MTGELKLERIMAMNLLLLTSVHSPGFCSSSPGFGPTYWNWPWAVILVFWRRGSAKFCELCLQLGVTGFAWGLAFGLWATVILDFSLRTLAGLPELCFGDLQSHDTVSLIESFNIISSLLVHCSFSGCGVRASGSRACNEATIWELNWWKKIGL